MVRKDRNILQDKITIPLRERKYLIITVQHVYLQARQPEGFCIKHCTTTTYVHAHRAEKKGG